MIISQYGTCFFPTVHKRAKLINQILLGTAWAGSLLLSLLFLLVVVVVVLPEPGLEPLDPEPHPVPELRVPDGDLLPEQVVAHGHHAHAHQQVHESNHQLGLKKEE